MRIRTDINEAIINNRVKINNNKNTATVQLPAIKSKNFHNQLIDTNIIQSISSKLNMEKTLGDALSIAQMSQNLIQKAIEISSRLKNIATVAITSGKVDANEINVVLADIKSSMGQYGEKISTPIQSLPNRMDNFAKMPSITNELQGMKEIATTMDKNKPGINDLDALNKNLSNKSKIVDKIEVQIKDAMKNIASEYTEYKLNKFDVQDISGMIVKNPDSALYAQGNLNYDIAKSYNF